MTCSLAQRIGDHRIDHEYIREGVCNAWMFVEPLAPENGWRDVRVAIDGLR